MTQKEIEKRIEEIEDRIWWIKMDSDFLTPNQRQTIRELSQEVNKLSKMLNK